MYMQKISTVGEDTIEKLKEKVGKQLYKEIDAPIRGYCQNFRERGANEGTGVKDRILDMFEQLAAKEVGQIGSEIATKSLTDIYTETEKDFRSVFERIQNPIDEIKHLLMSRFAKQGTTDFTEELELLGRINKVLNLTTPIDTNTGMVDTDDILKTTEFC